MKSLKLKIKEFLDQRRYVLHAEHEREYAAQKLLEMFDKELQKITPKEKLLRQIDQYKRVLKLAKVPKLIIEHPGFIHSIPPSKEDIEWAKKKISEHQEFLKFHKQNSKK